MEVCGGTSSGWYTYHPSNLARNSLVSKLTVSPYTGNVVHGRAKHLLLPTGETWYYLHASRPERERGRGREREREGDRERGGRHGDDIDLLGLRDP